MRTPGNNTGRAAERKQLAERMLAPRIITNANSREPRFSMRLGSSQMLDVRIVRLRFAYSVAMPEVLLEAFRGTLDDYEPTPNAAEGT